MKNRGRGYVTIKVKIDAVSMISTIECALSNRRWNLAYWADRKAEYAKTHPLTTLNCEANLAEAQRDVEILTKLMNLIKEVVGGKNNLPKTDPDRPNL